MKYKREINLSKILHIIKNKFLILFSFVATFCSLSFAYSSIKHLYNNPYISNATIVSNQNLTNKSIGTMSKLVTSTLVCNEVSFKLAEEGIKFSSGEEITPSYIQSNLSSSFKINTNRINVSFKSDEKNIIEQTLNAVLETTMEQSAKFDTLKNRFEIASHASPASRNFNTIILKNALLFSGAGLIFGLLFILIKEYYDDKIYYSYELQKNNLDVYEIIGNRKNKKTRLNDSIKLIANNLLFSNDSCFLFTATNLSKNNSFEFVSTVYQILNEQKNATLLCLNLPNKKKIDSNPFFNNIKNLNEIQNILSSQRAQNIEKALLLFDNPVNHDDSLALLPYSKHIFIIIKAGKTKKRDLFSLINSLDNQYDAKCIFLK